MLIEIWSDVVCPWCYIGKRRLESALAGFAHADEVEVVYRSFELDPTAPREPHQTAREMLAARYGMSAEQAAEAQGRVIEMAAAEGMTWQHEHSLHASSRDAHRLLHLALAEGGRVQQRALKERLLAAYFVEARNIADHAVLREAATAVGLDGARVDEVLASEEYDDAVAADIGQAAAYGATGVPFFVLEQRYAVSGAQPTELFAEVLDKVWAETHPAPLQVVADGDACGPDGCAV